MATELEQVTKERDELRQAGPPQRKCPTCRGDGFHPMANHPRTKETLLGNECPECKGVGSLPIPRSNP